MKDQPHPIIDAFLEELLSDKSPPDLSRSILNRLHEENATKHLAWEEAVRLAHSAPTQHRESDATSVGLHAFQPEIAVENPSPVVNVSRHRKSRSKDRMTMRWVWVGLSVTAATILLVVSNWWGGFQNTNPSIAKSHNTDAPKKSSVAAQPQAESPEKNDRKTPLNPFPIDRTPFHSNESVASQTTESKEITVAKMDTREIVRHINARFSEIWNQSNTQVAPLAPRDQWLQRVNTFVLGQETSTETNASEFPLESIEGRLAYLGKITETKEFAQYWSNKLADGWLGSRGKGDRSPARQAFNAWLAQQILKGTPLHQVQRELLTAKGSDHPEAEDFNAASHWLAASFEGNSAKLAEHLASGILDTNLACSRCHENGNSNPATYWGVAAVLGQVGIENVKKDEQNVRRVVFKKPSDKFYERKDGTMALAIPRMIDGSVYIPDGNTLEPLAEWVVQSSERKKAAINAVWNNLFGQRLVPNYGLASNEGVEERSELQQFLANQWSAHGEDVRSLVAWVAASKPFALSESSMTLDEYFLASEQELDAWRMADRQLAFFTQPRVDAKNENANTRLIDLAQTIKKDRDEVRAQPREQKPSLKPNATIVKNATAEHVRFFVHARGLSAPLQDQMAQWLESNMSWESLVDHVAMLTRGQSASPKLQEISKEVLAQSGNDRRTALTRILLTEIGYY